MYPPEAPQFDHVTWATHLPIMYNFWASMMLGEQSYRGNPFQKHIGLPIWREYFSRWLKLFTQTVDDNFQGERADEIKSRVESIANVFQHKMKLLR